MAKTSISSSTAFATGTDLVSYRDRRHIGDLLNDDDTRATDTADVENSALVLEVLRAASGIIEMAVYRGGRYSAQDLNEIAGGSGVSTDALKHLTCEIAFWLLTKRRKPDVKPSMVTGVPEALAMIESLRLGEEIFPFAETEAAEGTDTISFDPTYVAAYAVPLSQTSYRLFGTRARNLGLW